MSTRAAAFCHAAARRGTEVHNKTKASVAELKNKKDAGRSLRSVDYTCPANHNQHFNTEHAILSVSLCVPVEVSLFLEIIADK